MQLLHIWAVDVLELSFKLLDFSFCFIDVLQCDIKCNMFYFFKKKIQVSYMYVTLAALYNHCREQVEQHVLLFQNT